MLYDLSAIGWVAAAATAGVAVGYNYARRKYDNARRSSRSTRSPTILPLRHSSSSHPSLPPAVPSEVKQEQREESTETVSSQETAADVTEPGTRKRKSREFDAENSTKVSVGVNTDEPPRKKSRTPPAEAQDQPTEQALQEAEAFLADILAKQPSSIASEAKSPACETIVEADVSMSDEVYEPLIEPATLMTARPALTPEPSLPLAAPIIRTKPLPELATPPPVPSFAGFRSSPSPSAAEPTPSAPSTVLSPFASSGFCAYSTMSGSPFSVASKPVFAASSTVTTSSTTFNGFNSYTSTSSSSTFNALASRPSVFGGSSKAATTSRAYVFAETKPAIQPAFGGFASTRESFSPAPKVEAYEPPRQVALGDGTVEEEDELVEETEPTGDGALTSVTGDMEAAPVNTGEEDEEVVKEMYGVALHIWRDNQWTRSSVQVYVKWLRDMCDGSERLVCRQYTGAVRMNIALGTLATSAKFTLLPRKRDTARHAHSLLIDTVEPATGADGVVKMKAVKYWLKCGTAGISKFNKFVDGVRDSTRLPERTPEEVDIKEIEDAEDRALATAFAPPAPAAAAPTAPATPATPTTPVAPATPAAHTAPVVPPAPAAPIAPAAPATPTSPAPSAPLVAPAAPATLATPATA